MIQVRNVLIVLGVFTAFLGLGLLVFSAFNAESDRATTAAVASPTAAEAQAIIRRDVSLPLQPEIAVMQPVAPPDVIRLPDRANCSLIRGTDYVSDTERSWFSNNCVSQAQPPAALISITSQSSPTTYAGMLAPLKENYLSQVKFVVDLVSSPRMGDDNWRISVIQGVQNVTSLGVRIRNLNAPSCQMQVERGVLSGVLQIENSANLLAGAVKKQDSVPLSSVRSGLQTGGENVNTAANRLSSSIC